MPFEEYIKYYDNTVICVEADSNKYHHSNTIYDFSKEKNAFFSFTIDRQINLSEEVFSISCMQ